MSAVFNNNMVRVYNNTKLKLYQEVELQIVQNEFDEVLELIALFAKHESPTKINKLTLLEKKYKDKYNSIIKNNKRLLKNTEKRVTYNMARC